MDIDLNIDPQIIIFIDCDFQSEGMSNKSSEEEPISTSGIYKKLRILTDQFPGAGNISIVISSFNNTADFKYDIDILGFQKNIKFHFSESPILGNELQLLESNPGWVDEAREVILHTGAFIVQWNYLDFILHSRRRDALATIVTYENFHPHVGSVERVHTAILSNDQESVVRFKSNPYNNTLIDETGVIDGILYFKNGATLNHYLSKWSMSGCDKQSSEIVEIVSMCIADRSRPVCYFPVEQMVRVKECSEWKAYLNWSALFSNEQHRNTTQDILVDAALILPMAGHGSRFSVEGFSLPKPLLPVDGEPMFVKAIQSLPQTGNVVLVCLDSFLNGGGDEVIVAKCPDAKVVALQKVTQGQAISCAQGLSSIAYPSDKAILISACDYGIIYDSCQFKQLLNREKPDVVVFSFRDSIASKINPNMYSWLDVDGSGNIKSVSTKNFPGGDPFKLQAIVGTIYFRKAQFFVDGLNENLIDQLRTNGEYYVDDVINRCIAANLKVKAFEINHYIGWGTPHDYRSYGYFKKFFGIAKQPHCIKV
jgi:dTDP-glucose pyrophosphorylase